MYFISGTIQKQIIDPYDLDGLRNAWKLPKSLRKAIYHALHAKLKDEVLSVGSIEAIGNELDFQIELQRSHEIVLWLYPALFRFQKLLKTRKMENIIVEAFKNRLMKQKIITLIFLFCLNTALSMYNKQSLKRTRKTLYFLSLHFNCYPLDK